METQMNIMETTLFGQEMGAIDGNYGHNLCIWPLDGEVNREEGHGLDIGPLDGTTDEAQSFSFWPLDGTTEPQFGHSPYNEPLRTIHSAIGQQQREEGCRISRLSPNTVPVPYVYGLDNVTSV